MNLKRLIRSSVAKNAAALYGIQFANYLLPLITVPYVTKMLQPSGFGLVAWTQGLVGYLGLIVEYGFDMSVTRRIAIEREHPERINELISTVWSAKVLLSIISFVTMLVLCCILTQARVNFLLVLTCYGVVLGNLMMPVWLFRGMEKMPLISLINLSLKTVNVFMIFWLVKGPADVLHYAAILTFGTVSAGMVGGIMAFRIFKIKFIKPRLHKVLETLREGWTLFVSNASANVYTIGNTVVLGLLATTADVAYFSTADKVTRVAIMLLSPLSAAAFPRFSKMAAESKASALLWARRMFFLMGAIGLGMFLVITTMSGPIVHHFLGEGKMYGPAQPVLVILGTLPLTIALSQVLGTQIMLPFHKDKPFLRILMGAGILDLCLACILAPRFKAVGMAVAVATSEVAVVIVMLVYLVKVGLNPFAKHDDLASTPMTAEHSVSI